MRRLPVGLMCAVLVLATGCSLFDMRHRQRNQTATVPPNSNVPTPPAAQLVAYLNDNARRVDAVKSERVSMDAREGNSQRVGLDGMLVCQKPRNFRLKAKVLGKPGVDVGSNNDEFWFWNSQERPAYVMHCKYEDLQRRDVRLPIPFQPDMIVCALGIAEYDPAKNYEVRAKGDTIELIEPFVAPSGARMRKITVFNRYEARAPKPQVMAYMLQDEKGNEVCTARIQEVTVDPTTNAILPQLVVLTMTADKTRMEMTMRLRDIQSVRVDPGWAARLFSRQDLASFPGLDLATGREDRAEGYSQGSSFQRTGATGQRPGW